MGDTPLMIGAHVCGDRPLTVINCRRWRAVGCRVTCAARPSGPTLAECAECPVRLPIVGKARMRGMGDLVAWLAFLLFLRRLDIAERVGAWIWRRRTRQAQPAPQGKAGGCGCKARQEALNRAIPFNRHAH